MPEDDAGEGLDLEVRQRGSLRFGEPPDLCLREADVAHGLLRHLAVALADLAPAQPERHRLPPVEAFGVLAHRRVLARGDLRDDGLDGVSDGGFVGLTALQCSGFLQMADHGRPPAGLANANTRKYWYGRNVCSLASR